jgi:VWFA-related protein
MRRALIAVALLALAGSTVRGDDENQDQIKGGLSFRQEVQVTVVNVDAYVRDRDGRPVTDLEQSDFRVTMNGDPMEISNFTLLTEDLIRSTWQAFQDVPATAQVEAAPPAEAVPDVEPIWVVLYIDNENLRPLDRNRVLGSVREFVIDNLAEPVQMMVLSYERSLKVAQPFTSDSRAVTDTLRDMKRVTGGRVERDNRRSELLERITEVANEDASSGGQRYGQETRLMQDINGYAQEELNDLTFTLRAFNQAIGMLSGLEGRKSIVYVSSGLPMSPGLGLMHQYAITFQDSSILSRRSQFNRQADFQSLTTAANAQDVTLYTFDASGLNPLEGFSADTRYSMDPTAASIGSNDYQASLEYMAAATGGIAVVNANDLSPGFTKVRDDLFSYYSLGFRIESGDQDKVHRIDVEVPGRGDLDVRFRRRFVEKSLESKVQDRVFSSLMVDVDDNPMDLQLDINAPAPATGSRWTLPVHLSFPLDSVALLPEGEDYVGRVVLFVGARDEDGTSSEIQRQQHEVRIPAAGYEEARKQRFGLDVQLLMEEGPQRVALGLMDEITRQASYVQRSIRVP